jgi:hypothetical protein
MTAMTATTARAMPEEINSCCANTALIAACPAVFLAASPVWS